MLVWNNRNRHKKTWLAFIKKGEMYSFRGTDIPGVVSLYEKEFKNQDKPILNQDGEPGLTVRRKDDSLSTTFTLRMEEGVTALMGEGSFLEWVTTYRKLEQTPSTWAALGCVLEVQGESLRQFLHRFFPKEAEQLDATDPEPCILVEPEPETAESRARVQAWQERIKEATAAYPANYVCISTDSMSTYESYTEEEAARLEDLIMICGCVVGTDARIQLQKEILKKREGRITCVGVTWSWVWSINAPKGPTPPPPIWLFKLDDL